MTFTQFILVMGFVLIGLLMTMIIEQLARIRRLLAGERVDRKPADRRTGI